MGDAEGDAALSILRGLRDVTKFTNDYILKWWKCGINMTKREGDDDTSRY